jgi:hypothetical protein
VAQRILPQLFLEEALVWVLTLVMQNHSRCMSPTEVWKPQNHVSAIRREEMHAAMLGVSVSWTGV